MRAGEDRLLRDRTPLPVDAQHDHVDAGADAQQRDMVALRLKARYAYVLGTGATAMGANKVPVGAVIPDDGS